MFKYELNSLNTKAVIKDVQRVIRWVLIDVGAKCNSLVYKRP